MDTARRKKKSEKKQVESYVMDFTDLVKGKSPKKVKVKEQESVEWTPWEEYSILTIEKSLEKSVRF